MSADLIIDQLCDLIYARTDTDSQNLTFLTEYQDVGT